MLAHFTSWAGVPTWGNTASRDTPTPIEPYSALTKEVFITDEEAYPIIKRSQTNKPSR